MFSSRCRLAMAGAAMLLAGVVLGSTHVDVGAEPEAAGQGRVAVLESAAVATAPVVGRARGWGERELASGDHASRIPLFVLASGLGLGLLPLAGCLWWLSRPDRRLATSQRAVMLAASRAPPPLA
jgi:hypothetical protein